MIALAAFALREALRRRVFVVVAALTVAFLVLYALGARQAFETVGDVGFGGADTATVVGSTMLGLAMFSTMFLGVVLAVFLTLGAVRGDAESGILQPLVVRPVGRPRVYVARLLAAGGVSGAYTVAVYAASVAITHAVGGWAPGDVLTPGLALGVGVVIVCGLSLLGSVLLASTANGIAVFMAFGAGLAAGLLGQIGRGFDNDTLTRVGDAVAYVLPFEALYQHALYVTSTSGTSFTTTFLVQLGPLGGARDGGAWLWPFAAAYLVVVVVAGLAAFRRRDL